MNRVGASRKAWQRTLAATAVLGLALSAGAGAEVAYIPNHPPVVFHGSITPVKLPRDRLAPISIEASTKFRSLERPPSGLTSFALELNPHAMIDAEGLALCGFAELAGASALRAQKTCSGARVGHGFLHRVAYPTATDPYPYGEHFVLFNGRYQGKPALLEHVVRSGLPALNYVTAIDIVRRHSVYPTSIIGELGGSATDPGIPTAIGLTLGRRYRADGTFHSYLSASCALPSGIRIAEFNFARMTLAFDDGTESSSVLNRTCEVRR